MVVISVAGWSFPFQWQVYNVNNTTVSLFTMMLNPVKFGEICLGNECHLKNTHRKSFMLRFASTIGF